MIQGSTDIAPNSTQSTLVYRILRSINTTVYPHVSVQCQSIPTLERSASRWICSIGTCIVVRSGVYPTIFLLNIWTFHEWSKTAVPRNREPRRSCCLDQGSRGTKKSCETDSSRSAILHRQRSVGVIEQEFCLSMPTSILVGQLSFWMSRKCAHQPTLYTRMDCIVASSILPSEWGTWCSH